MKTEFDTSTYSKEYLMTIAPGVGVGLNMPAAIKDDGDRVHSLPPYRPRKSYLVDEYPACPEHWMRSTGRTKSYFVPVVEDAALWLDFNSVSNALHHVSVVPSIQGVNAITGMAVESASLEQYRDNCPRHNKPFGADRLCKDCGYKWPRQNYLASSAQPESSMWLDGFRAEDGVIRQYIFTKQKQRGVAKAIIGDRRVFALGISFFFSKEHKPKPVYSPLRSSGGNMSVDGLSKGWGSPAVYWSSKIDDGVSGGGGGSTMGDSPMCSSNLDMASFQSSLKRSATKCASSSAMRRIGSLVEHVNPANHVYVNHVQIDQMEIAAGVKIDQRIYDDPNDLAFWADSPEALVVINYATESECESIIKAGRIDLSGSREGFLTGLPIGNP
jgi:hypothetical protein